MSGKSGSKGYEVLEGLKGTKNRELSGEGSPKMEEAPASSAEIDTTPVLLSSRVPAFLKHEYDDHIIELRRSRSILNQTQSQIGMAALVRLLRDPKIKQRWHEELERMFDEDYQRKRRR